MWQTNIDHDQTPHSVAFDQSFHYLLSYPNTTGNWKGKVIKLSGVKLCLIVYKYGKHGR